MSEITCRFGQRRELSGIVSMPLGEARVGLVLVNAGFVAKAGPFRLYVEIARHVAESGIVTLRFDLGGLGHSVRHAGNRPLGERTRSEISAAVDELCRRYPRLEHVIVGGLCSGAEDAFRYAERDARITGVVMIDPFAYRTAGWYWRHLLHRVKRRVLRATGLYVPLVHASPVCDYKYMERAEASRILAAMIDRGAKTHFIYTGGHRDTFNHVGQLPRMFAPLPFQGHVTMDLLPEMDHTQLLAEDRQLVVIAITEWLAARSIGRANRALDKSV